MQKIDLEDAAKTMQIDCFLRMLGNMEAEEKRLETSLENLRTQINTATGEALQELQNKYATLSEEYHVVHQSLHG